MRCGLPVIGSDDVTGMERMSSGRGPVACMGAAAQASSSRTDKTAQAAKTRDEWRVMATPQRWMRTTVAAPCRSRIADRRQDRDSRNRAEAIRWPRAAILLAAMTTAISLLA